MRIPQAATLELLGLGRYGRAHWTWSMPPLAKQRRHLLPGESRCVKVGLFRPLRPRRDDALTQ
ncbi:hypothetical protein [Mumia zhuanghuii]|uniref:Uncharacterized protein n=1 Tax=Mumia zhuanghuii TaxID=2585211 RepID=A0A5C4LU44_9ACTN|nr:hypothetical protein [Mumia zhuanghuii]TNC22704.1 hypothetical protein FHE65_35705 [Mumia zhuanghuii]